MLTPSYIKRLMREEKELSEESEKCGFFAFPRSKTDENGYRTWDVFIIGAENTLYENTTLLAEMTFPTTYPINPPRMRFISKMFHPNIYEDGRVCISILQKREDDIIGYGSIEERWSPVLGIRTVVLSVISMLHDPNIESPADVNASKMFRDNREIYNQTVINLARKENRDISKLTKLTKKTGKVGGNNVGK